MSFGALTWLWLFPLLGGILVFFGGKTARTAKLAAAIISLGPLVLSLAVAFFPGEGAGPLSEVGPAWGYGMRYALMADGLSLTLCWLTAFLTVVSLLASWNQEFPAGYWACFLFLEAALMGVFLARDLFLFFIFWEAVLVPMFFIIGLWGSEGRRHAAMKFSLFTFFGSIFLLLGILGLVTQHHQLTGVWTWDMAGVKGPPTASSAGLIFGAMVLGFGVKIPLVPLHSWLPDAHTEAPAAGSVMLAGVLLKMGVYGFLRVLLPAFPELSWALLPWLGLIAAINVVYGAFCAMVQSDLKRLIAYSSVAHLGFCLLGVFSRTPEGLAGGSLQMINHGLSTGALFLLVGFLYERSHRRGLADFGDLASQTPWLSFFFGFSILSSIGLPGLNGFVGEFMSLAGLSRVFPALAIAGVIGVTLSAVYALPAFQTVFWGCRGPNSASAGITDLDARERAILWVLCLLMLAIGLYPRPWLRAMADSTRGLWM